MGRTAELVLVSPAGELLGILAPMPLACPYWPESADVVAEARAVFDARVIILRLLDADRFRQSGGHVSYLAELSSAPSNLELGPIPERLRERAQRRDPKRMPWAELGGPAQSLTWARGALEPMKLGSLQAVQQRTWNLSSLWRLVAEAGSAPAIWLKQVPHFMRYESRVLRWLNEVVPGASPTLLAADDTGRSLLAHVPGEDLYGASVATRQLILDRLHQVQCRAASSVDELIGLGVPDLRGSRRAAHAAQRLLAWRPHYPGLAELLQHHEQQLTWLEESGVPATLVHSDNHPGNARGLAEQITLLDWGEAFIGHPVTDLIGLVQGLAPAEAAQLSQHWCSLWKDFAPHSRPERALEAAPFIAAMHGVATYAGFLLQIEETEWPYHQDDVPRGLAAAAALIC